MAAAFTQKNAGWMQYSLDITDVLINLAIGICLKSTSHTSTLKEMRELFEKYLLETSINTRNAMIHSKFLTSFLIELLFQKTTSSWLNGFTMT